MKTNLLSARNGYKNGNKRSVTPSVRAPTVVVWGLVVILGVVIVMGTASGCSAEDAQQAADLSGPDAGVVKNIEVAEAARLIAEDVSVVVLDIRTPSEFARGHIKGAANIDFMADDFATKLAALDKEGSYVMHCQSGGRSGKSIARFRELGFKRVLHMNAGFAGWKKAGQLVGK